MKSLVLNDGLHLNLFKYISEIIRRKQAGAFNDGIASEPVDLFDGARQKRYYLGNLRVDQGRAHP